MYEVLNYLKNKHAVWSSRWHFSGCQKQLRRDKIINYTSFFVHIIDKMFMKWLPLNFVVIIIKLAGSVFACKEQSGL